jgi:iron complex transport system substrate-binding protein
MNATTRRLAGGLVRRVLELKMPGFRKLLNLAALLAIIIAAGGCTFQDNPAAATKPRLPGKLRVVSLAPNVTEMLFLLGAGDNLVGVTEYCDYPPEARQIERVGGFAAPNMEKLISLSPDLVATTVIERAEVGRALRERGIKVMELRICSIDDMFAALRALGEAVNRAQAAEDAVARMQAELDAVAEQFRGATDTQRPRVFVEIQDYPLMTIGGSSFVDDVVTRAGGINLTHDYPEDYPRISAEKIIEWNPDAILLPHNSQKGDAVKRLSSRIGWAEVAAVKNGLVIDDIPDDLILRPGPRLIDGIKLLAQRLNKPTGSAKK